MKFYVSTKGIKRVGNGSPKITATTAAAATGRRISNRTVIPAAVVLGILSLFAFFRVAILALDSSFISSSFDCVGWRFFSSGDTTMKLRAELIRALMEANDGNANERGADTFNELVNVMASKQDLKAFAFNTKAMVVKYQDGMNRMKTRKKFSQFSFYLFCLGGHGL